MGKRKAWLSKHKFQKGHPYLGAAGSSRQTEKLSEDAARPHPVRLHRLSAQDYKLAVRKTAGG